MAMPPASRLLLTKENYQQAHDFTLNLLREKLPGNLSYHSLQHTTGVVADAEHLAEKEKVSEEDKLLLLTAAVFHDTGFIKGYAAHEESSCAVAKDTLPQFGYSPEAIAEVCKLIRVTKLPQQPKNLNEQILCDADLYYLGSSTFFRESENLYKEFSAYGVVGSREEWELKQLHFLNDHQFFTATALAERARRKKAYLKQVRSQWKAKQRKALVTEETAHTLQDVIYMILGVLVSGFALKSFLVANHFLDGGISGISLLIHELYHFNLALVLAVANLPLILMGYFSVGRQFAIKTGICITLLAVCLQFIPYPPILSDDKILVAVFGGFFIGVGIGLCMRAGCALDGVEVLAVKTFRKTPFTVSEIILAINILIFAVAAFNPKLGIMTALYSILTYFTATKSIDFVVEGIEAYTGVTIISGQSDLMKHRLVNELGRGITVYKGERGFLPGQFETSTDCDIIFTVVTRLELRRLKNLVHETDPKAFVFASTIREASGGILRRRAGEH